MDKSKWPLRIALLLGSFVFFLVVAEVGLRIADFKYAPITVVPQNDFRGHHAFKDNVFIQDPKLIWRPKPDAGPFNSLGYRGDELSKEPAEGEFRLLAVGDSNTLGWYGNVHGGTSWPTEIQKLLKEEHPKASVLNAGAYGYTAYQGKGRLKEMLEYHPDLILISFGSNDCHPVGISDEDYASRSVGFSVPWAMKFRLGHVLASFWDRRQKPKEVEGVVQRVSPEQYKTYLREMIGVCKENDIPCALVTRPYIGSSDDPNFWKTYAPEYQAATFEVSEETGVPVIDVYEEFHQKEELYADESHFTQEGHELAAKFVVDKLKSLGLL